MISVWDEDGIEDSGFVKRIISGDGTFANSNRSRIEEGALFSCADLSGTVLAHCW